jgi:hypothetical protein
MEDAKYKVLHPDLPAGFVDVDQKEEKRHRLGRIIESLDAPWASDIVYFLKRWLIADFCLKYNFKKVLMATTGAKVAQ